MDLETFLVSLYVLIDDWWRADRPPTALYLIRKGPRDLEDRFEPSNTA